MQVEHYFVRQIHECDTQSCINVGCNIINKNIENVEVNLITFRCFLRIHVYDETEIKGLVQRSVSQTSRSAYSTKCHKTHGMIGQ